MARLLSTTRSLGDIVPLLLADGGEVDSQVVDAGGLVEALGSTFVFRPGDPAGNRANIYVDWPSLQAAYVKVAGPKRIQYDSTFAALVIPAGTWSFEDSTNVAAIPGLQAMVTFAAGANAPCPAHMTLQSVVFAASDVIFTGNASTKSVWRLQTLSNIHGGAGEAGVPVTVTDGTIAIFCSEGSSLGDGTNFANVVDLLGTAVGSFEFFDASISFDHWLIGGAGASAFILQDSSSAISTVTDGALVPTYDFPPNPNFVTAQATVAAAAAAPYNKLVAPAITRKGSGIFEIHATLSISVNGGSLADGDSVSFTIQRVTGALNLNEPAGLTGAVTATGGNLVVALCTCATIDDAHAAIALGSTVQYALRILATNGHTSGVVAVTDGFITVREL